MCYAGMQCGPRYTVIVTIHLNLRVLFVKFTRSDVDDSDYIADEGDASSESAGDEEEEEIVEAVPEQHFDASSDQTPSSPPTDLQQPSRTASTTRTTDSSSMRDISFMKTNELLVPPPDSPRGNTYCTGTLNKKRKDNPSEVISKKLKKGETI
ncbi:unnamed protein product [Parnassius apollo]|uniref:(apollo) hypothetical protein n=1 Tax=Parnassius apollo TaxID=110799 RepID=A0A8S3X8F8_PARAO|nr:unnamed protein product [Parnassius apollo]